jgi:hypothetical protein
MSHNSNKVINDKIKSVINILMNLEGELLVNVVNEIPHDVQTLNDGPTLCNWIHKVIEMISRCKTGCTKCWCNDCMQCLCC